MGNFNKKKCQKGDLVQLRGSHHARPPVLRGVQLDKLHVVEMNDLFLYLGEGPVKFSLGNRKKHLFLFGDRFFHYGLRPDQTIDHYFKPAQKRKTCG